MGLFRKKKDNEIKEKKEVKSSKTSVVNGDKKDEKKTSVLFGDAEMAYRYIIRPWITEKTQEISADNKYVFKVRRKVSKKQAKIAIEKLYSVKIEKINAINIPQKRRRFGRIVGKKSAIRKMVVTLKDGHKIDFFE